MGPCRFTQQQEERTAAVTAEYDTVQQQLAQLHLAAAELGSTARMSEAQQQLAQMTSTLAAADKEHAARVAGILRKLQVRQAQLPIMLVMGFLAGAAVGLASCKTGR
jgi:ABC-type transport system involved in cytochrome bd biosynthesis fused ATPase/permease subunit